MKPIVGIIMGSDSDLPIMSETAKILERLGIAYELTAISAHRMPDRVYKYAKGAEEKGLKVIIAGAGGAAHLPGVIAASTVVPVIGVPIKTKTLSGVDSLYSIVQMPSGIPVATVAINGAKNAGILAAQIISTYDENIRNNLKKYKSELKGIMESKARKLESIGFEEYLKQM